ncbi:hypothetical protein A2870_00725 [Candidatus Curtissbacteria bacterium RIFCSPHIGHO2_01_FULL_41_11]|uniref:Glycosyltransferase RgtA/B/C/D-like domain-containing protein n=1 Tax=Candidatus Curtissbacteria bacterium RIFCSPHIGHO2_01_FULL_41_11 TaxID=1797711 RepID=A0A1F5G3D3_9BACT|nr:MAG: hypothetical protein A2870_00725 [Candidatus Curtissbacteria bacterium RIFCSPHIGHO2_01_FULL_41_11]
MQKKANTYFWGSKPKSNREGYNNFMKELNLREFLLKRLPVLALFIVIAFHLSLINKTFSEDSNGNLRAASAGYGDIPFHMTQVSKFAFQKNFNFNEPIYDGERLRYAFGINLISGFLLRYTNSWPLAMHLPAMGFMVAGIILTYLSYRLFLKSETGAVIAVVIFLLGSGFGAGYLFRDYSQSTNISNTSFFQYITDTTASTITKWNAIYPDQNIAWGAPLSLVFLHQRAFFIGFFLFSLFWYLLWNWIKYPDKVKWVLLLGVVVGLTPLAHYHSFVAMLVVLGVVAFVGIIKQKKVLVIRLILLGFIILVLAIPQVLYLVQGKSNLTSSQNSFLQLRLGWMSQPTTGSIQFPSESDVSGRVIAFLNFLWINFGIILPMFIFSTGVSLKSKRFRERFGGVLILSLAAIVLFLSVQLIRFQPWDYDDNKILVYFQFFAAPVIVSFFLWLLAYRKLVGRILLAAFTVVAIHSGVVDQIPRLLVSIDDTPVIFNRDAISLAEFIKEYIPADKKIITTSTHLNPVASLAGRSVFVGYPGWLWTRGIDYSLRESHLKEFYADPIANLNKSYISQAYYVLLDPTAVYDWKASEEVFDEKLNRIFSNDTYSFYKLR